MLTLLFYQWEQAADTTPNNVEPDHISTFSMLAKNRMGKVVVFDNDGNGNLVAQVDEFDDN